MVVQILIKGVLEGILPEEDRVISIRMDAQEMDFCKINGTVTSIKDDFISVNSTEKHPLKIKYIGVSFMDTNN
jgi:hypothetical protein